jgi:hypothetical protein
MRQVLSSTRAAGLPDTHIIIKMATVLPRVMPSQPELRRFRSRFEVGIIIFNIITASPSVIIIIVVTISTIIIIPFK